MKEKNKKIKQNFTKRSRKEWKRTKLITDHFAQARSLMTLSRDDEIEKKIPTKKNKKLKKKKFPKKRIVEGQRKK